MKILLISPYYSPGVGGSSRLLEDIVVYLNAHGHAVHVLTYGLDPDRNFFAFDRAQSYPVHRILPQRLPGGSSLAMAARLLRLAVRERYDLIFCGVAFPSAILAWAARPLIRLPYVVYSHGEDVTVARDSPRLSALLSRVLRGARAVMTNSRFTKREVEALGVPADHVVCVPPGIDPLPYEQTPLDAVEALRARLGVTGRRVILTVARLTARKGHDIIIRALSRLRAEIPDLCYLIVGKGDPEDLQRLADNEGVRDQVVWVDYVPDGDLPALYHVCDVYAMVSRWDPVSREVEGFGIVYLEAGACGKPSVAGSAGGSGDAVEDGVTGLVVDPTSVDETAAALRALLLDGERATQMGLEAQRRVRQRFHRDVLLAQIARIVSAAALPHHGLLS